jgi:hypothetical protein
MSGCRIQTPSVATVARKKFWTIQLPAMSHNIVPLAHADHPPVADCSGSHPGAGQKFPPEGRLAFSWIFLNRSLSFLSSFLYWPSILKRVFRAKLSKFTQAKFGTSTLK